MAFTYYKSVTIDHTQCGSSNSTDFPVAIYVTDADLKTTGNGGYVLNSSGFDIRPYSDITLTTALTFELVVYTPITGQLEMHVKIPTLDASTNVVFYLAFGNSSLSTDGSSTSAWDSSFLEVYHFGDGTTLGLNSSVSGGHTLTNHGATASAAEVAGGAAHFVAASSQYMEGVSTNLGSGDFTMEVIVKYSGVAPTPFGGIFAIGNTSGGAEIQQYNATGVITQVRGSLDANIGQSGWLHIVLQRTGAGGIKTWNNGSASAGATGGTGTAAGILDLGNRQSLDEVYFDGDLDEVRVSTIKRSDDYITASYNNQKVSSTFLSWGALTPFSSGAASLGYIARPTIMIQRRRR